jgi:signal transduction histidine kinase
MTRSIRVKPQLAQAPSDGNLTEQFRAIAELRGDVCFIIDCASAAPLYISASITDLLGYPMDDFIAQFNGVAADGSLSALWRDVTERLARFALGDTSRGRVVRQVAQRHRDGHTVPLEIASLILTDARGQALTLVGSVRDVSAEQARLDEQRRFASMLNHEFRTPLSTIDGAIQRLEVTGAHADEATRQRYRKISTAVDRLTAMLDQYLSPDRLEEIGYRKRADSAAPRQLLEQAAEQLRAAGRPVTLELGELPDSVRCQPDCVSMALKVLVDNALHYAPAGSAVTLSGHSVDGGVALVVRDQGRGVPPAEIALIFNKHYRASNTSGKRAGLGLYMARSVMEVHGGTVEMRNVAPTGAEFRIWLPLQRQGARPAGK